MIIIITAGMTLAKQARYKKNMLNSIEKFYLTDDSIKATLSF